MTRADIEAVIALVPQLNDHGIGIYFGFRSKSKSERDEIFARDQAELLQSEVACTKVCEWLATKVRIATVNDRHSSYGLKHMMQRETGFYVTNGIFIAAAIHSGFVYKVYPGSPNVCFGISERSLKKAG